MRTLLLVMLCACGTAEVQVEPQPEPHEFTMCEYDVEGTCVIYYAHNMNIDPAILSDFVGIMEYEVNYYYPGLNFAELAEQQNFILIYDWANYQTEYQGTYSSYDTTARVWVRRGDNISAKMGCSDRYFVAIHEMLHFIVDRYIKYDYGSDDPHNIPNIFDHWAMVNDVSVDLTVEGRMYSLISRYCFTL